MVGPACMHAWARQAHLHLRKDRQRGRRRDARRLHGRQRVVAVAQSLRGGGGKGCGCRPQGKGWRTWVGRGNQRRHCGGWRRLLASAGAMPATQATLHGLAGAWRQSAALYAPGRQPNSTFSTNRCTSRRAHVAPTCAVGRRARAYCMWDPPLGWAAVSTHKSSSLVCSKFKFKKPAPTHPPTSVLKQWTGRKGSPVAGCLKGYRGAPYSRLSCTSNSCCSPHRAPHGRQGEASGDAEGTARQGEVGRSPSGNVRHTQRTAAAEMEVRKAR